MNFNCQLSIVNRQLHYKAAEVAMKKIKTMIVFGTRPEVIKLAPLIKHLRAEASFELNLVATAQHREMLDQMVDFFHLDVDYDLGLMKQGQSLAYLTKAIIKNLNNIIKLEEPELIIVHGDTTTAFCAGLVAFYNQLSLAHVEAGLRSFSKREPFPEEMNRRLIAQLSDYHFAPSKIEADNLVQEGVLAEDIFITGNTVIDTLVEIVDDEFSLEDRFSRVDFNQPLLLVTVHRRENFGQRLKEICLALQELARQGVQILFPVHYNPEIKELVEQYLSGVENIYLVKPLSYSLFVNLMAQADLILTDSGGIQEEAPTLNTPVLVLRDRTERKATLETGAIKLIGRKKQKIIEETSRLLKNKREYKKMIDAKNPYGTGNASSKIIKALKQKLEIW